MWPDQIELLDDGLCLIDGAEPYRIQGLSAQGSVESLIVSVPITIDPRIDCRMVFPQRLPGWIQSGLCRSSLANPAGRRREILGHCLNEIARAFRA